MSKSTRAPAWGAYSRISDDSANKARGEAGSGVARQNRSLEAAIGAKGGGIHKWYVEDDTSAFKKKRITHHDPDTGKEYYVYRVVRPVWKEMLRDLRDGVITAVMVADLDRLTRDGRDLEDAIELVEHYGALIYSVDGSIDLTTDGGKSMARVLVSFAAKSSSDTRRRVTGKHVELSTSGRTVGGIRPFGWGKDGDTKTPGKDRLVLHPVESVHLRAMIDLRLRGSSWREIVQYLNDNAVKGTRGRPMIRSSVRQLIFSPRNCGYRLFHGELSTDANGSPLIGQWEPICTVDEWLHLTSGISVPRSVSAGGVRASKYLLTNIARCGVCMAPMQGVGRRKPDGTDASCYTCPAVSDGGHYCVARNMAQVDNLVTSLITQVRVEPETDDAPVPIEWDGKGELVAAEQRKHGFIVDRGRGKLTDAVFYELLDIVNADIKELRKTEVGWVRSRDQRRLATTTWSAESWTALTVNQKRTAIRAMIIAVEIHRTTAGPNAPFDASKINIVWRDGITPPMGPARKPSTAHE